MKSSLTLRALQTAAVDFAVIESEFAEPLLYGVTDGKAIGTYLEKKFVLFLADRFSFAPGNSAKGIDLPSLNVDIKVTSVAQPQSSCPYRSARQKIYGLGYHLLVFVYEKTDDRALETGRLNIRDVVFIDSERTGDFQMTTGLIQLLRNEANVEDLVAFMTDRNLPVDEIEATAIAEEVLAREPVPGCLTISNALQWRLQYGRALQQAGAISGVARLR